MHTYFIISGDEFTKGFAGCINALEVNNHYIGHEMASEGSDHKNMKSFHGSFNDILEVSIPMHLENVY